LAFEQHLQADGLAEVALTDGEGRLQQFQQSGVRGLQHGEGFLVGERFVPQGLVGQAGAAQSCTLLLEKTDRTLIPDRETRGRRPCL
jgi:hypothetical protein